MNHTQPHHSTQQQHCNTALQAEHVQFSYGDQRILEEVNFTIEHGRYVGLIGPNGGGKSTLLKLILGLLKPEHGTIHGLNHTIGYVPQRADQLGSDFPATVAEVVGTAFAHTPSAGEISAALRTVNLPGFESRLISRLSGGQRQRVYIARALATRPNILLLDEPTVGIDALSEKRFYKFLQELHQQLGLTIVLVSHDLETIRGYVDTLLVLNRTVRYYGPTAEYKTS